MSRDLVLGFDVGATNTRASVGVLSDQGTEPHPAIEGSLTTEASSKGALYDFVVSVLRLFEDTDRIEAATFAVAGPVEGGVRAKMTNWAESSPIHVDELVALGLPKGRTQLVNDLYAGARGLTSWLDRPHREDDLLTIHEAPPAERPGNLVFLAPGTGLGTAGIVRLGEEYYPVAAETQHSLLPVFDEDVRRVIEQFSAAPSGAPSWEDVASGVGLSRTYLAYCAILGQPPHLVGGEGTSREVAEAALAGQDEAAVRTLELYYRVLGRYAQMIALTFQPCEAVYIGGASTRRNREFIQRSTLVEQFLANRVQGRLLSEIPVRLVLQEVNLDGALSEAARVARSAVTA